MSDDKKTLILVDDNITNLTIGKSALSDLYAVFTVPSGEKLFPVLKRVIPDMILLDVSMPFMDGYDVIKVLKENENTKDIPVIFLTAKNDTGSELEGLSLGAVDYIAKPFSVPLLKKRIEVHLLIEEQKKELKNYNDNLQKMVAKKTSALLELQDAVLSTVSEIVECRDVVTGNHIERTQRYLGILIDALRKDGLYTEVIDNWNMKFLLPSAQLHDVGKIYIKDTILNKPGKLSMDEFEEMKKHAEYGRQIIEKIEAKTKENDFLRHAKIFAETHHENWNGTGYPHGLSGETIPLEGRLLAIADVYDALVSERPYKTAFSHEEAINIIITERGRKFDPALIEVFEKVKDSFRKVNSILF